MAIKRLSEEDIKDVIVLKYLDDNGLTEDFGDFGDFDFRREVRFTISDEEIARLFKTKITYSYWSKDGVVSARRPLTDQERVVDPLFEKQQSELKILS